MFGCAHEYRAMTPEEIEDHGMVTGRCLHHYICDKCQHTDMQDSRD
jgi:hypothetical protein